MAGPGNDLQQAEAHLLGEPTEPGWRPEAVRGMGNDSHNWTMTAHTSGYVASTSPAHRALCRDWLLERLRHELDGGAGLCGGEYGGGYADIIAGAVLLVAAAAHTRRDDELYRECGRWFTAYLALCGLFAVPHRGTLVVLSPGNRARTSHASLRDAAFQTVMRLPVQYVGSNGDWRGPSEVSLRSMPGLVTLRDKLRGGRMLATPPHWSTLWARKSEVSPATLLEVIAVVRLHFPLVLRAYADGSKATWFPRSDTWDAPQPASVYDAAAGRLDTLHPKPRGVRAGVDTQWWSKGDTNTVEDVGGELVGTFRVTNDHAKPRGTWIGSITLPRAAPVLELEIGPHGARQVPIGSGSTTPAPQPTPPTGGPPMPTPQPPPTPDALTPLQQQFRDAAIVAGKATRNQHGTWPDGWLGWLAERSGLPVEELRVWFEGRR